MTTFIMTADALTVQWAILDNGTMQPNTHPILIGYAENGKGIQHGNTTFVVGHEALHVMPHMVVGEQVLRDPQTIPVILKTINADSSMPPIDTWITAIPSRWGVNQRRAEVLGDLIRASEWIDTQGSVLSIPEAIGFNTFITQDYEIDDSIDDPWMVVYIGHEDIDCAVLRGGEIDHAYQWSYGKGLNEPLHAIGRAVYEETGNLMVIPQVLKAALTPSDQFAIRIGDSPILITWLQDRLKEITNVYNQWRASYPELKVMLASESAWFVAAPKIATLTNMPIVEHGKGAVLTGLQKYIVFQQQEEAEA